MKWVARWLGRILLLTAVLVIALLLPVGYVEVACRGGAPVVAQAAILPAEARRSEARTLLTYPEWHIVHAYEDYAAVVAAGDPHDFGYLASIGGFWSSLCDLSREAPALGGTDWPTKRMVYVIGVSFTAEFLLKAAYEETLGRGATWVRGEARTPLDDLSARQAADYAAFLTQVPWYEWDFLRDAGALDGAATDAVRDRERQVALGLEYRAKAGYAGLLRAAMTGMAPDALTLRSVVTGLTPTALSEIPGVQVIAERAEGVEIETPRYAAFTDLAQDLAARGAEFVEIAGNDDILFTLLSDQSEDADAVLTLPRQGLGGFRHLRLVKVADLAGALRAEGARVEHVHDY